MTRAGRSYTAESWRTPSRPCTRPSAAWRSSSDWSTGSTKAWPPIRCSLRLYPEPEDLAPARHRLTLFLAQYWGGPSTYNDERGHPRLRMRHAPFAIGPEERDHWLVAMRAAIASMDPPEPVAQALYEYFDMAAESMRNRF